MGAEFDRGGQTSGIDAVEALVFDMFGTVVDWRESVAADIAGFLEQWLPGVDPHEFADAWRTEYQPSMEQVRNGSRHFVRLDVLHRENLESVLDRLGVPVGTVPSPDLAEANLAWHRLDPWPDTVPGLARLRRRFVIAPLSNANVRMALDVAKRAGLPWDAILGAEVAGAYKPEPAAYLRTAEILGLDPGQVMMVAAHNSDLAAAQECGLHTAFVRRPTEHGPGQTTNLEPEGAWDLVAEDFEDLANRLT